MERELRDPSPASVPPPPAPIAPPPLSSPRRPSIPPPLEVEQPAALAVHELVAAPASVRPPFDSAPESELQRAIREASLAGPPVMEPAAVWNEAASDLRERRSNPPPPAAPTATRAPAAGPATPALASTLESAPTPATPKLKPRRSTSRPRIQAATASTPAAPWVATPTPPVAHPVAPLIVHQAEALEDEVPRLRRARRPGASRRGAAISVVGALLVAGGSLTWAIVERSGAEPGAPRGVSTAATGTSVAPSSPPSSPPTTTTPPGPSPVASGGVPAAPASPSPARTSPPSSPAPALRNPATSGLLRVEHADTVELYLQGVRTGTTNQWLEVACGPKNIRLARPGAAPPGHSFPMWLGEAATVHVRCGEVHAIRWTRD